MWMGAPWHADAASCGSGYRTAGYAPPISPFLPTFWPARVPNEVLAQSDYDVVMDTSRPMSARRTAFAKRRTWIRPLATIPVVTRTVDPVRRRVADPWGGDPEAGPYGRSLSQETEGGNRRRL